MERDTQLDLYRALSIIYVICVTHVLYWMNIGSEPILSLILIEMPIIFFVSGAALSLKETRKGFLETIWNRFKRVVIPYYIYALVMILFLAVLTIICIIYHPPFGIMYGLKLSNTDMFNICDYGWYDYISILSCTKIPQTPFAMHLWFILPYIILSCTFGLQIKLIMIFKRWMYLLVSIVVFFIVQSTIDIMLLKHIFFYNIFMIIGYLFYKRIKQWQIIIMGFISLIILVNYHLSGGWFVPLQNHKFPPDLVFLTYNIFVLCFLSLIFSKTSIPNLKIFQIWNHRGYTLYLYQNVIFFIVYPFYWVLIRHIPIRIMQWLICALIVFVLSTIVSCFTFPFERQIMRKLGIL